MSVVLLILALCAQAAPAVTDMSPSPGSLHAAPAAVILTLNQNIDPASVSAGTVTLVGSGPDGLLGTGDDLAIVPSSIMAVGNQIILGLAGQILPDGLYRVRLSGTLGTPTTSSGLYGYWKLEEGGGTTTADSSGNGRNGTLNGPSWTGGGPFGNGLVFSPGINKVDIDAGIVPPPWTASMWVNRNDSPGVESCLMDSPAALSTATSLRLEQFNPLNHVGITDYNVADYSFAYIAPVGTWVHLTFVGNSLTSTSLYVNGALTDTISHGINLYVYKLGGDKASSFSGILDEVQVYNRTLTAGEILSAAGLTGCIRSTSGGILDGEFSGSFPSGNGTPGQDFSATFTVSSAFADLTAGGCGGLGVEALLPLLFLLLIRRLPRSG